jgi:hypothetical protein
MDSLPYVSNNHHAPLVSHTPLFSPGPLSFGWCRVCGVGACVVLASINSVGLLPPL